MKSAGFEDDLVMQDEILALEHQDREAFDVLAERVYAYQCAHNPVVAGYAGTGRFLPIEAFREVRVATFAEGMEETRFVSSGTGSGRRSSHVIRSLDFHDRVALAGFKRVFGSEPTILVGHLPGYARESSLVHMTRYLADQTGHSSSGVFHDDPHRLEDAIVKSADDSIRLVLIGAAFGLLDLIETRPIPLGPDSIVVETGGMKTHRREIGRESLHELLAAGFGIPVDRVWSEYGMCELTSQAWATGGVWYAPPPWMRVVVVDPERPDRPLEDLHSGRLAIVDLANLHTASFLLTEDLGMTRNGSFAVLGRLTGASLRGCNFLFEA